MKIRLEKNQNNASKSKEQISKGGRQKPTPDESELEKKKNDVRRFQEQVRGADPVNENSQCP